MYFIDIECRPRPEFPADPVDRMDAQSPFSLRMSSPCSVGREFSTSNVVVHSQTAPSDAWEWLSGPARQIFMASVGMNDGYIKSYCMRHTRATAIQQAFSQGNRPRSRDESEHGETTSGGTYTHDDITYYFCGPRLQSSHFRRSRRSTCPDRKQIAM